ncbi:MAG TPA: CHRD domain-containing protein, partial [Phycisphaerae bacterium]|nr:CHRD domain-containing protein [Phycisphaerae bacterium]
MHRTTLLIALLVGVAGAHADVVRNFILTPDQVVPASGSPATGHARATLNAAETEIEFLVQHNVAEGDVATASVYAEDAGSNGAAVFALTNVNSNSFSGIWSVSAGDVAKFLDGGLYVQIETPSYPAGEIRGQIRINPNPGPGDVIITEIMYNPASTEGDFAHGVFTSNAEWVELFNTTFTDIDIGGWFLQDEDVDTNGDACTPLRSGSIPEFILPSFGLVVIIPDGQVIFGSAPTVADFKTAWGLGAASNVLQVDTNGTAGGALVGHNLSNNPFTDGFDINDLPLDASFWIPCDPGGFDRPDNEILTLNDGTQIIDVVNYGDDYDDHVGPMDWPEVGGFNSIALAPDDFPNATSFTNYTATGNDSGAHWIAHEVGDNALGYRQVAAAGVYGGEDVGSPCRLRGATTGNLLPAAIASQVMTTPGATEDIFMQGSDLSRPFFGLLLFVVKSLPQNGQLIDVASNKVITPAMLGANGYLMPRIPFNQVRYVNNGTCGRDSFTFATNDGL